MLVVVPSFFQKVPLAGTMLSEKNSSQLSHHQKKNVILMKVTGDSMEPKIEDGDTVMIDIGKRQLQSGSIYALGYDDTIVIKEVEKLPEGKVLIISKNRKMYPPYEADINSIRIIGQVIWGDRIFVK